MRVRGNACECVRMCANARAREMRARESACEEKCMRLSFLFFSFLSGNFVDYERFVAGFFLLRTTFDSLDSYCNDAIANDKIGTARLNLKFNRSTNPVLRMYILSRYQVELLIDSNRQAIRDYSL